MVLCMGVAIGATSAEAAVIRRRSLLERSWKQPKLSLTKWFQAFYLVGEAKTGISSRSLKRKLGMNFRTAWLLHHKIRQAMGEREESDVLQSTGQGPA